MQHDGAAAMTGIVTPEEVFTNLEFRQRDLPGFATVNVALREFEPKLAFSWHLSLLLQCADLIEHRLPSPSEQNILYDIEDRLSPLLTANGNAVFLARVTYGGVRELMWRVHDPEAANSIIQEILRPNSCPRPVDYRMDEDREWQKAMWYLDSAAASQPPAR